MFDVVKHVRSKNSTSAPTTGLPAGSWTVPAMTPPLLLATERFQMPAATARASGTATKRWCRMDQTLDRRSFIPWSPRK